MKERLNESAQKVLSHVSLSRPTSKRFAIVQFCAWKGTSKPYPKRQILDASKLTEFADDNFEFDENGRNFYKWVENIVRIGETAHYEQFLLFLPCFQQACSADT